MCGKQSERLGQPSDEVARAHQVPGGPKLAQKQFHQASINWMFDLSTLLTKCRLNRHSSRCVCLIAVDESQRLESNASMDGRDRDDDSRIDFLDRMARDSRHRAFDLLCVHGKGFTIRQHQLRPSKRLGQLRNVFDHGEFA